MIPEDRQAELFARWLDNGGKGLSEVLGEMPEDVDFDAFEAVFALRPDLAPGPKTSIDEILAHLDEGPALGDWVDGRGDGGPVGRDVQEGVFALRPELAPAPTVTADDILERFDAAQLGALLDGKPANVSADVAEAVYALLPDSAPRARASIDDILAKVTSGPLAAPVAVEREAEIIAFPAPKARPVDQPIVNKRPQRGRMAAIFGSSAVGLLAAAAAVTLFVLPQFDASQGPASHTLAPPVPVQAPVDVVNPPVAPIPEAADVPAPMPVETPKAAAPPVRAMETAKPAASKEAPRPADSFAEIPAAPPKTPMATSAAPAPALGFTTDSSVTYYGAGVAEEDAPSGMFGGTPVATADDESNDKRAAEPAAAVAVSDRAVAAAPPRREYESLSSSAGYAGSPAATAPGLGDATSAQREKLGKIEKNAEDLAAKGRYADAARTLMPAIVAPRAAGQYYAAKACEWYLRAGRPADAMRAADAGLSLGSPIADELAAAYSHAQTAIFTEQQNGNGVTNTNSAPDSMGN